MGNVEVEIYMTNFVGFFKKNPDQLKILIGDFDDESYGNVFIGCSHTFGIGHHLEMLLRVRQLKEKWPNWQ